VVMAEFADCFDMVCWSVCNWLVNASIFDDSQHEKSKRSAKALALLAVTELDGSTPSELFTVMSLARSYAEDQQVPTHFPPALSRSLRQQHSLQMNILSFSLLYDILVALPTRETMVTAELDGPLNMALATLQGRIKAQNIEDVALEYCLHLLKQAGVRKRQTLFPKSFQFFVPNFCSKFFVPNFCSNFVPNFLFQFFRFFIFFFQVL
jgi:hypothetical protein